MLDSLRELAGGPLPYLLIAGLVAADALVPMVPGEVALLAGSVLAASGELAWPLVALAGIAGAAAGDNLAFVLGRGAAHARLVAWAERGPRGRERLERVRRGLVRRDRQVIVTARFIPGGRTAVNISAGALGLRWRRFAALNFAAACLWTAYICVLGAIGGSAFEENTVLGVGLSIAIAVLIGMALEMLQRHRDAQAG